MKKKVRIEKESMDDGYSVIVTTNGFQWSVVFTGSLGSCFRIASAYVSVGFEAVSAKGE